MIRSRFFSLAILAAGLVPSAQAIYTAVRIVDEGATAKDWSPIGSPIAASADYPSELAERSRDVCVSMAYRIDKDGKVPLDSLVVLRVWSSDNPDIDGSADALRPFVQSAAANVVTHQFQPTPGAAANRVLITSATTAFVGSQATPVDAIRARCEVKDLRSFIADAQRKTGRRSTVQREEVERYQRTHSASDEILRTNAARAGVK